MPGYVLNSDILTKIDGIAVNSIKIEDSSEPEVFYSVRNSKDNEKLFKSPSDIDQLFKNPSDEIIEITSKYEISNKVGLTIAFYDKGKVEISGYSQASDFEYRIDQIVRELKRCEQDYNWLEANFAINSKVKKILFETLLVLFIILVIFFIYVAYAQNVGIDIADIGIVPDGNTYYKNIEDAIKGDDLNLKINTLLMGELKGFSNVTDIISRYTIYIRYISIATIIVFILFIVVRNVSNLYPLTFFEIGDGIKKLKKIKGKREVWGIVVILGFIVNVTAGLLLAIFL